LGSRDARTWVFGSLAEETNWRASLLGVGSEEMQHGEVRGFLKVFGALRGGCNETKKMWEEVSLGY
jgi:hypothetical protein